MFSDSPTINPYQPTVPGSISTGKIELILPVELDSRTAIEFSGTVSEDDLEDLLTLTTVTGVKWMLLLPIMFGTLIILINASWPWIMSAVGVALLFLVLVSLLSRSYRRFDFCAFNVKWDRPMKGSITRRGIELQLGKVHADVQWSDISNSQSNDRIVAFQSALHPSLFSIIPRHAVSTDDDWRLLKLVAESIHCDDQQKEVIDSRMARAKAQMTEKERESLLSVPPDAITFAGAIREKDIRQRGSPLGHKRVLIRWLIYLTVALVGISAILTGIVGLLLDSADREIQPTPALLVATVCIFACVAMFIWIGSRRRLRSNHLYCEQNGYATAEAITVEYGCFTLETQWPALSIKNQGDDHLVLSEANAEDFITLRRDMFASDDHWERLKQLAHEQTNALSG